MNKFFLQAYIYAMTKADLIALSQRHQIQFSDYEVDYLFPIVKTRWREFFNEVQKELLLEEIDKSLGRDATDRMLQLLNRLGG